MDLQVDVKLVNRSPLLKGFYWFEITDEEKLEAFNGVGPEFFPSWLRRLLDIIFNWAKEAVFIHDVDYSFAEGKLESDFRFLLNLLMLCDFQIKRIFFSVVLFLSVLFFGGRAFRESRLKK